MACPALHLDPAVLRPAFEALSRLVSPPATLTVAAFLERHDAYQRARNRPKTHVNDMARLRRFLGAVGADRPLSDIAPGHVATFLARPVWAPATVSRYREALHAFFEHARRSGLIWSNPVAQVPRLPIPERPVRFLDRGEIHGVLSAVAGDPIAPIVATCLYGGLRREEACWLTPADVDLDFRLLAVRSKNVGGEHWHPKNRRNREVPIFEPLVETVERFARGQGPWLFPSIRGCRWDPDNLGHRFTRLMRAAGLDVGFNVLRHTLGTTLGRNGWSSLEISLVMGNTESVCRRFYIGLRGRDLRRPVEF